MTERWLAVARKDFDDAIRSWALIGMTAFLCIITFLVVGLPQIIAMLQGVDNGPEPETMVWGMSAAMGIVVPITAIIAAYLSIAGERRSGSLKLLLSLPPTRRDVVAGKLVGRSATVVAAILVAYLLGVLLIGALYDGFPLAGLLVSALLVCLLGVTYTALSVGFSAMTSSRALALVPLIGIYLLSAFIWEILVSATTFLYTGILGKELPGKDLYWDFISNIFPSSLFSLLYGEYAISILEEGSSAVRSQQSFVGDAFYVEPWFSFLLLVIWIAVPMALGYWRFEATDLE